MEESRGTSENRLKHYSVQGVRYRQAVLCGTIIKIVKSLICDTKWKDPAEVSSGVVQEVHLGWSRRGQLLYDDLAWLQ